jgi:hypothetical protein
VLLTETQARAVVQAIHYHAVTCYGPFLQIQAIIEAFEKIDRDSDSRQEADEAAHERPGT